MACTGCKKKKAAKAAQSTGQKIPGTRLVKRKKTQKLPGTR